EIPETLDFPQIPEGQEELQIQAIQGGHRALVVREEIPEMQEFLQIQESQESRKGQEELQFQEVQGGHRALLVREVHGSRSSESIISKYILC
ncbi:hypothetical protein HPB47_014754, partial [Ixodes persulcatus]